MLVEHWRICRQGRLKVGDDQIHGEVAAGLDPDAAPQKGHEYPQVTAQLLEPGEAVVENITGEYLYETDEGKPENGPYQCRFVQFYR